MVLGLCSVAIPDVSYDLLFMRGAERVETVLVGPASDLDCTVIVCGSHVKPVSTRSDCTDLDAGFFFDFFFWHGEVLRVRGNPADLPSASRTCPSCS